MAKKDFFQKLDAMKKLRRNWRTKAATIAVNFSKERFVRKNWVDTGREPWPAWSPKYAKSDAHGASLMIGKQSGRLKKSIRKLKATQNTVVIGTDVPYAEMHNEGIDSTRTVRVRAHTRKRKGRAIEVKAHTRKMTMPQRRFIGESAVLGKRLEKHLQKEITKILKK